MGESEKSTSLSGYELSRAFFDWCFENPELVNPNHIALYFFIVEHCNRLGWKNKFGLPSSMAKDAIGIKNYRTYTKTLYDLVGWGFIKIIQESKNQYTSCIVAIVKNTKAHTKAYDKALHKHIQKQVHGIVSIDKPINQEPLNQVTATHPLQVLISQDYPNVSKLKSQLTEKQAETLQSKFKPAEIKDILDSMENKADLTKKYSSVNLTIQSWMKFRENKNGNVPQPANTYIPPIDHF